MRKARVYRNGTLAGILEEESNHKYVFTYADEYLQDEGKPPISLTLPKSRKRYVSNILFPFFYNMLSEGVNRTLQSRSHKIDENDHFGLLLKTAKSDTIGAVTIEPIEQ